MEMSRQHSRTSYHSQQARTFTDYCMPLGSDRNKSSHLLLFRCRRRECFGEGPPLRHATLRLSCSLAASCVSASTLPVAMVMQHIFFAQSLLRMDSAKWKTLKQVMFEKIFAAFYGPLFLRCSLSLRITAIVRIKRRGISGTLCAYAVTLLVHK